MNDTTPPSDWLPDYQTWLLEAIADRLEINYAEAKAEIAYQATQRRKRNG